jgi:F-type H+-transporting ATPase subunit b
MFWLWLVLIQLFIFTMLVVFLRMLLTRNVTTATAHLHELNQDYNDKVEAANKRKAEVDQYYNEMLLKAKADAEKQKVLILREAQETQEAVLKDARRQGEDIIANAHKAREEAMKEIDVRVDAEAQVKAAVLMGDMLTSEMSEHLHQLWMKELLKTGLDDLDKLHVGDDMKEVKVQSAFPLTAEQKSSLQKKFQSVFGKNVTVSEEPSPELIAGMRIQLGSVLVDGSLQFKIKEIARDAKQPS